MSDIFHHGISVTEKAANEQAIRTKSPSIIGLIATADDADPAYFPLNVPKLVTRISEAQGKAGTSGTLASALSCIASQARPIMVIVRVAEGTKTAAALPVGTPPEDVAAAQAADDADQLAKTIGKNEDGTYTGINALLMAESITGAKPKILGAPGLDKPEASQVLVAVAKRLWGMAYHHEAHKSVSASITAAEAYGDRESLLIRDRVMQFDVATKKSQSIEPIALAMGVRAATDAAFGWHKTISNTLINGISGIDPEYAAHFDLLDPNTEVNLLNQAKVTCIINKQGFRFWGNRTGSSDDQFTFESATRTAQVLRESIADAHFPYIDKPLTPGLARDIIEGVAAYGRDLVARGYLLGFRCWYEEDLNETDQLKQGRLTICYEYTPVPPLENLSFIQIITDKYFADFGAKIASGVAA